MARDYRRPHKAPFPKHHMSLSVSARSCTHFFVRRVEVNEEEIEENSVYLDKGEEAEENE